MAFIPGYAKTVKNVHFKLSEIPIQGINVFIAFKSKSCVLKLESVVSEKSDFLVVFFIKCRRFEFGKTKFVPIAIKIHNSCLKCESLAFKS